MAFLPQSFRVVVLASSALLASGAAFADGPQTYNTKTGSPIVGTSSSGRHEKSFVLSSPVVNLAQETIGHLEMNLGNVAAIAVEGAIKDTREDVSGSIHDDTGESRRASGKAGAFFLSHYLHGASMGSFYGGVGLGFREESVRWRVAPDETDRRVNLALAGSDHKLHHDAEVRGPTGQLRLGYRYVAHETPLLLGAYVGGRYFQGVASDASSDKTDLLDAPMTDGEKSTLEKQYQTRPEAGLEIGLSF